MARPHAQYLGDALFLEHRVRKAALDIDIS